MNSVAWNEKYNKVQCKKSITFIHMCNENYTYLVEVTTRNYPKRQLENQKAYLKSINSIMYADCLI